MTETQKLQALKNAQNALAYREKQVLRRNSFAAWGNAVCSYRTLRTIRAMQNGTASINQYRYWLTHPWKLQESEAQA